VVHYSLADPGAVLGCRRHHSSVAIGERYVHLAVNAFSGAAAKTEERLFGAVES
jgi:hypothetical protein